VAVAELLENIGVDDAGVGKGRIRQLELPDADTRALQDEIELLVPSLIRGRSPALRAGIRWTVG
jgi:hypothetical protein